MTNRTLFRRPRRLALKRFTIAVLREEFELEKVTRAEAARFLIDQDGKIAVNVGLFNAMRTNVVLVKRLYCCPHIRSIFVLCKKK